jgi:MoaA/NifB/PqqE/SkfB family radical SAM enzyme
MRNNFLIKEKSAIQKRHWVRISSACNNQCVFCLDRENQGGGFLSLAKVAKELTAGRRQKINRVVLSGGEATIHPKFIDIVKLAKNLGYRHIQVITNGRMFCYSDFFRAAVEAGLSEITFSIHGHIAALHDKQTGVKGSFDQAIRGLVNALAQSSLIISVDVVISKINYRHLADILKFFISLGVREFDLLQIIPFGRAWDNRRKLFYNIKKAKPYLDKAFELSRREDIFLWTNRLPIRYLEGYEDLAQHPQKIFDEVRGRQNNLGNLFETGRLLPCFPARCRFCFLEDFCREAIKFKKNGEVPVKKYPVCLVGKRKKAANQSLKRSGDAAADLKNFADFYIRNLYFVKSARCGQCVLNESCEGAPIQFIRQFGFKKLKPIKNNHG